MRWVQCRLEVRGGPPAAEWARLLFLGVVAAAIGLWCQCRAGNVQDRRGRVESRATECDIEQSAIGCSVTALTIPSIADLGQVLGWPLVELLDTAQRGHLSGQASPLAHQQYRGPAGERHESRLPRRPADYCCQVRECVCG